MFHQPLLNTVLQLCYYGNFTSDDYPTSLHETFEMSQSFFLGNLGSMGSSQKMKTL